MLEIIVVGRADNHTGDFTGRLLYASKFNAKALTDAKIDHQFTFVEWNSPAETLGTVAKRFVDEVPNAKAYVVGHEWHTHSCDNPNMVIMEFFAKNVAIRRSESNVIVCTNADILFGPDTIELLAGWKGCAPKTLYRAINRHDIKSNRIYEHVDELKDKSIIVKSWKAKPPGFTQGAGDFQMARTDYWKALGGYDETIRWAKIHKDHRLCSQVLRLGGKVVAVGSCYHLYHSSSYVNQKRMPSNPPWGPEYNPETWMPYHNPRHWGLSNAKTTQVLGVTLVIPPSDVREIPPLKKPLYPINHNPAKSSKSIKHTAAKQLNHSPRKRIQPPKVVELLRKQQRGSRSRRRRG